MYSCLQMCLLNGSNLFLEHTSYLINLIVILHLLASGDFCLLLIIFANSLDPDQDRQTVGPDLDPNHLTLIVFLQDILEIVNFERSADNNKTLKH